MNKLDQLPIEKLKDEKEEEKKMKIFPLLSFFLIYFLSLSDATY